ncbi:aldo-keto reductase [Rhodotorula toruloides]|uniref:Aldo-keto reductase n=1 Tax=Rhodotorula toruloides TaxID=5286 RepID=A0A511KPK6_RHOTO|nr:aldo-keto reductase [Rhodotorula toruloides]
MSVASATSAVSIVTITSIVTNSDGSSSTMLQESASALPVKNNTSSGPSGKTWGIIGGVVGGVAVVVVGCLLFWRLTQRRFSNLDHDIGEIKWPELQPEGGETNLSTLNPPATRKTGGAGVEMEKDRELGYDTDEDEFGRLHAGGGAVESDAGSPRLGYGPNGREQFYERGGGLGAQSPYELAYAGGGAGAYGGTYYDPYLGTPAPSRLPPGAAATAIDPFANPPTTVYPSAPPTIVYPPPSHQHPSYPNPFASSADDVPLTAAQVPPAASAAAAAGGIPYNARAGAMSPGLRY